MPKKKKSSTSVALPTMTGSIIDLFKSSAEKRKEKCMEAILELIRRKIALIRREGAIVDGILDDFGFSKEDAQKIIDHLMSAHDTETRPGKLRDMIESEIEDIENRYFNGTN